MDILSGIFKQIHNFNVNDIFKQSMNVIQRQLLKPTEKNLLSHTKKSKSLVHKDSPLECITVDQIDVSQNSETMQMNEIIKMKLTDQISVGQVSTTGNLQSTVNTVEYTFDEKNGAQNKRPELNESCIHVGINGKLTMRDVPKLSERKNKIMYNTMKKTMKKKMNESISFSGGGYNCVYHLGVVKYIFENADLFKGIKYLGASGGAGIASIALCYETEPIQEKLMMIDDIIRDIIGMRSMNLKLSEQVERYSNILERYIDEEKFNKYIKRNNRCYISVTDVSDIIPKNIIMNNFESYAQYVASLKASACIPLLLDDTIRTIDGKWCLDGGLSNNMPTINEHTLKISCLNYPFMRADIYPKKICELKYSFISPEKKYIMDMFNLGYNDIEQYMKEHKQQYMKTIDVDQCIRCLVEDPLFVN